MDPVIETRGLTKVFGRNGVTAVDSLDLNVKAGETFGLLGPNGSGKTTTIRMLNCVIRPTAGTATVNGHDIIRESVEVKRSTGMLAESPGLYEKLSAREFLEFMGGLYDVPRGTLSDRMDELLRVFGLTSRADHLLEGFSRGMKQKVLIAAALIHDPPVIFLDEPTATLDPKATLMVKDLIRKLSGEANRTVFISSHILPLIEELCDRVGIIDDGRLLAIGTVEEVIRSAGADDLEGAYISITGGIEEQELLAWRGGPG